MDDILEQETSLALAHFPVKQTTVTGIVRDRDGVVWVNCGWKAVLVGYVGAPPIYIQDGTRVPTSFNGTVAADGTFTGVLPANDAMTPPKTRWRITIYPLASCAPSTFDLAVTGATQQISTILTQSITPPRFKLIPGQFGYADIEVSPPPTAGTPAIGYANTTTGNLRIWNGTKFVDVTTGALPPNAARTDAINTYTIAPQIFDGTPTPVLIFKHDKTGQPVDQSDWRLTFYRDHASLECVSDDGATLANCWQVTRTGLNPTGFIVPETVTINASLYVAAQTHLADVYTTQFLMRAASGAQDGIHMLPSAPNAGFFNPIVRQGDNIITFDNNGILDTSALCLTSHSGSTVGIRIDGAAKKIDTWAPFNVLNSLTAMTVKATSYDTPLVIGTAGVQLGLASDYKAPYVTMQTGYGTPNQTSWRFLCFDGSMNHQTIDDGGTAHDWMVITRVGAVVTGVGIAGNLSVSGSISATSKPFVITHPLDAEKKLIHCCIEGAENAVYYRGEDVTDSQGLCSVTLPHYFEALTAEDGRTVQLTMIDTGEDTESPLALLAASRVKNGAFRVRSDIAYTSFSWEVKAVRKDIPPLVVEMTLDEYHKVYPPIVDATKVAQSPIPREEPPTNEPS